MKRFAILSFLLSAVAVLCAQWHIDQNFDAISTIPAGWTVSDDGDGMTWRNLNNASHAHSVQELPLPITTSPTRMQTG